MKFTEAQLESAIIELLEAEGYPHVLGDAIDPPDGAAGRQPQEVLIKAGLRAFLAKQYGADHITPQEIEAVINRHKDASCSLDLEFCSPDLKSSVPDFVKSGWFFSLASQPVSIPYKFSKN